MQPHRVEISRRQILTWIPPQSPCQPIHPATPGSAPSRALHWVLYTHTHNHFTALCILSATTWVSRYQKKHSPTHTHRGQQSPLSASSIYYDPWHRPCSIYMPDRLFPQSLSKFSLVYLLAWHPPLHTPYISSPNHYHLFATHAHTIGIT